MFYVYIYTKKPEKKLKFNPLFSAKISKKIQESKFLTRNNIPKKIGNFYS